jgi:hypothetical protein
MGGATVAPRAQGAGGHEHQTRRQRGRRPPVEQHIGPAQRPGVATATANGLRRGLRHGMPALTARRRGRHRHRASPVARGLAKPGRCRRDDRAPADAGRPARRRPQRRHALADPAPATGPPSAVRRPRPGAPPGLRRAGRHRRRLQCPGHQRHSRHRQDRADGAVGTARHRPVPRRPALCRSTRILSRRIAGAPRDGGTRFPRRPRHPSRPDSHGRRQPGRPVPDPGGGQAAIGGA